MNAFISYSIGNNEQYILTLLAQKMSELNLNLVTSYNQSNQPDPQAGNQIRNCALFIGLMTAAGSLEKRSRVYSDFKLANLFNRPAILLIEDTVQVGLWEPHYPNTIRFNRFSIGQAMEEVKRKITASQTQQPNQNAAAWILGGLGILALLSLLSSDKK